MDYSKIEIAAQELLDIQSINECQNDLLERIIEQLAVKLDICTGFPIVGLFTTLHKVGQSFFDYKMCMRLLAEEGINGGGFTEDSEAGIIYSLNTYSKVLLEII